MPQPLAAALVLLPLLACSAWAALRCDWRVRRMWEHEFPWEPAARDFAARQRRLAIERRKRKESDRGHTEA